MIIGILKIILYAFLAYIIFLIFRFFRALNKASKPPRASKGASGIMVKDEFCNTYLPKENAIRQVYEGKEYYFCSSECRQKFLEQKKSQ
ncbi:MAG: YHS domain-containing protein [Candidatus Aminicenantes bacterium]|nr:YHS domain-containing protein [Candidatus Aminicenantes bacterium]